MQQLIFCLTICLTLSTAAATDKLPKDFLRDYDLVKMEQTLAQVKSAGVLPAPSKFGSDSFAEMKYQPSPALTEMFFGLQKEVFGKVLINLKFCSDCFFDADISGKNVYINPAALEQILNSKDYANPMDIIKFALAHELSHFVQELSAHPPYAKVDNWTDSGFPSYFYPYQSEAEANALNSDKNFVQAHVEVDLYAYLIVSKLGFKGWNDLFKFFTENMKELSAEPDFDQASSWDIEARVTTLKKVLGMK